MRAVILLGLAALAPVGGVDDRLTRSKSDTGALCDGATAATTPTHI